MALKDDITALPTTVGEGSAGHLGNHATIHAGMKDHETRITTAEANKADKTALDARVPSNTALRLDTTVGTRIFAGTTMIHGDTGWRDISTLGEGIDFLRISRHGSIVNINGGGVRVATGGTFLTKVLPAGFLPTGNRITRGFMVIKSAMYPVGNASTPNRLSYESPPYAASVTIGDQLSFEASWITTDPWPSTLPGLPA